MSRGRQSDRGNAAAAARQSRTEYCKRTKFSQTKPTSTLTTSPLPTGFIKQQETQAIPAVGERRGFWLCESASYLHSNSTASMPQLTWAKLNIPLSDASRGIHTQICPVPRSMAPFQSSCARPSCAVYLCAHPGGLVAITTSYAPLPLSQHLPS